MTKEQILNSKKFKEWQKYGLITESEFLEAYSWLKEDKFENNKCRRALALTITSDMLHKITCEQNPKFGLKYNPNNLKGKISKLHYVYNKINDFVCWVDIETGKTESRSVHTEIINARDNIFK
ncbi:hypothetical protein [uncultured Sneathia sp.]|jgi:hypothetical protein|uniref:hypothetical protein n=1 Tax=uncultured Sneathia sp. TaxID=278067 RepID=UPI002049948F|nr:hypothetical protein [uncultured Sneathia sp.]DAT39008.1 MAG TPA: hypothetical protein [Caudoviricetes sp.]